MQETNGTGRFLGATVLGARRRVNGRPETITFDVETASGLVVPMRGYCKGRNDGYGPCPPVVQMEVEAAHEILMEASWLPATDEERTAWDEHVAACAECGEPPGDSPIAYDGTVYHYNHAAEVAYRRAVLIAVIPELREDAETASVLAADGGDWLEMLRDLGWWRQAPVAEIADPEVVGDAVIPASAPTGDASSPTSVQSIPEPASSTGSVTT